MNTLDDLQVYRAWRPDDGLHAALKQCFSYGPGDDRATGYLYAEGEQDWPAPLADYGPQLLIDLQKVTGERFTYVAFQAYKGGTGCDWHADTAFDAHAILSLGVTRAFGVRSNGDEPEWIQVAHGDLVVMPSGFQERHEHCVPVEDVKGERCSLVFRNVVRERKQPVELRNVTLFYRHEDGSSSQYSWLVSAAKASELFSWLGPPAAEGLLNKEEVDEAMKRGGAIPLLMAIRDE